MIVGREDRTIHCRSPLLRCMRGPLQRRVQATSDALDEGGMIAQRGSDGLLVMSPDEQDRGRRRTR
jgi:hypothetical protein